MSVPYELRGVIKKATDENPDKRYQTPEEMSNAISLRQNVRKSVIGLVAALLISAAVFGIYFSMFPEPEDIEFVKPAPKTAAEDIMDDGFDPNTELGLVIDTVVEKTDSKKMKEYEAKAEQIFRKNFTREAERVLSQIYTNENMNSTEKNFAASNQSTMGTLVKAQVRLGQDAGLNDSRSQVIASQIIDQVTSRLKAEMKERDKKKDEE